MHSKIALIFSDHPPVDKGRNQMQKSQYKSFKGLVIGKMHVQCATYERRTPNVIAPIIT